MAKLHKHTITRDDGVTIQIFHNEDTGLIVVDLISVDETGGIEIVRTTPDFSNPFLVDCSAPGCTQFLLEDLMED